MVIYRITVHVLVNCFSLAAWGLTDFLQAITVKWCVLASGGPSFPMPPDLTHPLIHGFAFLVIWGWNLSQEMKSWVELPHPSILKSWERMWWQFGNPDCALGDNWGWPDWSALFLQEMTVKGLEPEIQRLIAQHKTELKKVKSIHEAEMLESDERASQRYVRQIEELRDQLATEKEAACSRERQLAKESYVLYFQSAAWLRVMLCYAIKSGLGRRKCQSTTRALNNVVSVKSTIE